MITRTTLHLSISRGSLALAHVRAYLAQRDPLTLLVVPAVLVIIGLLFARQLSIAAPVVQPAALPAVLIIATAQAQAIPTPLARAASALPTAAPRLVVAFDSPDGTAFPDPIPEPPPSSWIGRWGDGWIEVQWAPNPIWIRAADIGVRLADVRPAPDPQYQVSSQPLPQAAQAVPPEDLLYGLTDTDMDRALADHNAQQLAWCEGKATAYCDMVRGATR